MGDQDRPGDYPVEYDEPTQEIIINAVTQILMQQRKDMATKVIVIAEIINDDGRRGIWTCTSPGIAMWDEAGLLTFALDKVRNFELLNRLAEVGRDDD